MLTNPPYGKDWKKEQSFIADEAARGEAGRFGAGLPKRAALISRAVAKGLEGRIHSDGKTC